jgi:hypothetical protein
MCIFVLFLGFKPAYRLTFTAKFNYLMKLFIYAATAVLVLAQCTTTEPETVEKNVNFEVTTKLMPYLITAEDSVHSAKITLSSDVDTVVNYVATLTYQGVMYRDSLPFTLTAGLPVNGQIIFSECPIAAGEKPTLTSTLKPLD